MCTYVEKNRGKKYVKVQDNKRNVRILNGKVHNKTI